MAARGADHSSTPTMDWGLDEKTFDFLSARTRQIDKNASETPMFMHDATINLRRVAEVADFAQASSVWLAPSSEAITVMTTILSHAVGTPLYILCVTNVGRRNFIGVEFQFNSKSGLARDEDRLIQERTSSPMPGLFS